MAVDQSSRLEAATAKAENGSDILFRFSNNPPGMVDTESGQIPTLKKFISDNQDQISNTLAISTSIFPSTAAGIAATANGNFFLVASADSDEIYILYKNNNGTAQDTGKRTLSSSNLEAALEAANQSASSAQTAAQNAVQAASDAQTAANNATEQLQNKANIDSPTFTGTPQSTTPAVDDNSQRIATSAFVIGQAGSAAPVMDGTAAPGTSLRFSRQDHVHPTDNSRAPVDSPAFTGDPKSVTPSRFDNDTSIATSAYVKKSGRRSSGVNQYGAAKTLTSDDVGATVLMTNANGVGASYTVTLPLQSATPDGEVIRIVCNLVSGFTLTVACQGSDKLTTPNANPSSITMQVGDILELTAQQGGYWLCSGGTTTLGMNARFASSFGVTGFAKSANGKIEQWTTLSTNSNGDGTFTFPTGFPNGILSYSITVNASNANQYTATRASSSNTQFTVKTSSGGAGAALSVNIKVEGW